ncbi:MAG: hypothetical protein WBD47_14075 [Phormidesmis sp.]
MNGFEPPMLSTKPKNPTAKENLAADSNLSAVSSGMITLSSVGDSIGLNGRLVL